MFLPNPWEPPEGNAEGAEIAEKAEQLRPVAIGRGEPGGGAAEETKEGEKEDFGPGARISARSASSAWCAVSAVPPTGESPQAGDTAETRPNRRESQPGGES